ncbi:MAG: Xaa-Pro aminopeptidase [Gaiellaceae bacterium]|jgi:Xaa-Pro aminopeptidase|nr:Xaa-Pro aminopeptidase [Gaiellaceae bacterium]
MSRVDELRRSLEEPLLVSNPVNVRYLVGFSSSNAALLVEPERVQLFTDFRYAEAARAVEGTEFVETKRSLYAALAELLDGPVGFEADAVSYTEWQTLSGGPAELVPRRGFVEALRAVKDKDEQETLRRAGEITSKAYERFADERFVGRTERELAWRLNELFHELGADAQSFESIVASGPNSARPHARPTDRELQAGETVVIDAGAMIDGYCADCTRTFATGPLPDDLKHAYETCLEGQLAGLEAVRPGVTGVDADAAARDKIEAAGLGEKFGHGLGHGVGLQVHEAPRLSRESSDTLVAGNAVTVEPGVYLEGLGGIRIEDLVIIGDDGPEVLTSSTKDLVTVS